MKRPAVFFDRDNTLIVSDGYLGDPEGVVLVPGAPEVVARVRKLGYAAVTFSNQSGVARGMFTEEDVHHVNSRLDEMLTDHDADAVIDRHEFCPHHPDAVVPRYRQASEFRKPAPGMIYQAARQLGLDLGRSWVIGDASRDIEAGRAAGCQTILFRDSSLSRSAAANEPLTVEPDFIAATLQEAADIIENHPPAEERATGEKPDPAPATSPGPATGSAQAPVAELWPTEQPAAPVAIGVQTVAEQEETPVADEAIEETVVAPAPRHAEDGPPAHTQEITEVARAAIQPSQEEPLFPAAPVEAAIPTAAPIEPAIPAAAPVETAIPAAAPVDTVTLAAEPVEAANTADVPVEAAISAAAPAEAASAAAAPAEPAIPAEPTPPSQELSPPSGQEQDKDEWAPSEPVDTGGAGSDGVVSDDAESVRRRSPPAVILAAKAARAAARSSVPGATPEILREVARNAAREAAMGITRDYSAAEPSSTSEAVPDSPQSASNLEAADSSALGLSPSKAPAAALGPLDQSPHAALVGPMAEPARSETPRVITEQAAQAETLVRQPVIPYESKEHSHEPARLARLEEVAEQILFELKRQSDVGADFSVSKLMAGITMVLSLALLVYAYLYKNDWQTLQSLLLLGLMLQAITISLLIMGRQK